jgi:mycothiol system anti-sigma-R factor
VSSRRYESMNCEEWFEKLYQYLDRDLDGTTIQEIEVHLEHCRPCWDRAAFERKLKERLQKSCCKETCTESLRARVKAILEKY